MKTYLFSLAAMLFFLGTTLQAQNIYSTDSDRVVTKVLGADSIHSNLSLSENLMKIPAFSRQLEIFELIDFDKMTEQHQMVTVFVVRNTAFEAMDEEELEAFFSASNRQELSSLQSYYIIPGRVDEHAIKRAVANGGGSANFRAVNNNTIRFVVEGETIHLFTENGSRSKLNETNFYHNKGLFHIAEKFPIQKK